MGITIDEMTTEVVAEPKAPASSGAGAAAGDLQLEQIASTRAALAATLRIEQRTRAEGFDD